MSFYGYLNSIPNNLLHYLSNYFMIHKRSIAIHSIANSFSNKQELTLDYSVFCSVFKSTLWMARKTVKVKHKSILDEMNSKENFQLESANFNLEVQHSNIEVFLTKTPLVFTIDIFQIDYRNINIEVSNINKDLITILF